MSESEPTRPAPADLLAHRRLSDHGHDEELACPVMRVSSGSDPKKLGSALTHRFASGDNVRLRAVGAASVNNAVKGIAIAQSFAPRGVLLVCSPAFVTVEFHDASISAIELLVTQNHILVGLGRARDPLEGLVNI